MLQSYHQFLLLGTGVNDWWDNLDKQVAFCRGDRGFIAFNDQYNVDLRQTLQVRYVIIQNLYINPDSHCRSCKESVGLL
jgi:hypothetical protein